MEPADYSHIKLQMIEDNLDDDKTKQEWVADLT